MNDRTTQQESNFENAQKVARHDERAVHDGAQWVSDGEFTYTLEAAAAAGKTPQALAYAATSKALARIHEICIRFGCSDEVMHEWLERTLASATTGAPAAAAQSGDREFHVAAVKLVRDIVDVLPSFSMPGSILVRINALLTAPVPAAAQPTEQPNDDAVCAARYRFIRDDPDWHQSDRYWEALSAGGEKLDTTIDEGIKDRADAARESAEDEQCF